MFHKKQISITFLILLLALTNKCYAFDGEYFTDNLTEGTILRWNHKSFSGIGTEFEKKTLTTIELEILKDLKDVLVDINQNQSIYEEYFSVTYNETLPAPSLNKLIGVIIMPLSLLYPLKIKVDATDFSLYDYLNLYLSNATIFKVQNEIYISHKEVFQSDSVHIFQSDIVIDEQTGILEHYMFRLFYDSELNHKKTMKFSGGYFVKGKELIISSVSIIAITGIAILFNFITRRRRIRS